MEENGINAIFLGSNHECRVYYVEELGETFYQSPKITTKPKLTKKEREIILATLYDRMDEIESNELEGNPQLDGDYSLEDFKTLEKGYKNLQELFETI